MVTTIAPYTVIVPARLVGRQPGQPTTEVYVRRRLLAALVVVAVVVSIWFGAGNVLANRGGAPASTPAVRPVAAYVVQSGDTMWSIAMRFSGERSQVEYVDQLVAANGGASLAVGQTIPLP